MGSKPYIVAKEKDAYYCRHRDYNIPVFGSIGSKKKAQKVCDMMNESIGKKERRRDKQTME